MQLHYVIAILPKCSQYQQGFATSCQIKQLAHTSLLKCAILKLFFKLQVSDDIELDISAAGSDDEVPDEIKNMVIPGGGNARKRLCSSKSARAGASQPEFKVQDLTGTSAFIQ